MGIKNIFKNWFSVNNIEMSEIDGKSIVKVTRGDKTTITVNGKQYIGKNVSINGDNIVIDGVQHGFTGQTIKIDIVGDVDTLESGSGDVTIHGNANKVKTGSGDVEVFGDVFEDVITGSGDVECINIRGTAKTGSGDISAKTISGNIKM